MEWDITNLTWNWGRKNQLKFQVRVSMSHSIEIHLNQTLYLYSYCLKTCYPYQTHLLLLTYYLYTYLWTYLIFLVFWWGNVFWDNLNRLLGLGLHIFKWSETLKIWLGIEGKNINSNSKLDFFCFSLLKSISIKPYICIHIVSKHVTPTKLTYFSLPTTYIPT